MMDVTWIAKRLEAENANLDEQVKELLTSTSAVATPGCAGFSSAAYAIHLWGMREEINRGTDHPLIGASELMKVFAELAPEDEVALCAFENVDFHLTLFFRTQWEGYLGFALFRHRTEAEERERLDRFHTADTLPHQSAPQVLLASR